MVQQGDLWVEFYFRQGQLVCVGPMRANTTLIERLTQAQLLSPGSLPQVRALIDPAETNETRLALTLINEGYLSREVLRAWASHETSQILRTVLSWSSGEIYFEEDRPTPANRLLVALSISTLLETLPASTPRPAGMGAPSTNEPMNMAAMPPAAPGPKPTRQLSASQLVEQVPPFAAPAPGTFSASQLLEDSSKAPATGKGGAESFLNASQLIDDLPFKAPSGALSAASLVGDAPPPAFAAAAPAKATSGPEADISMSKPGNQVSLIPPQPVANPLPPARIDTSFMTPDLVLVPTNLAPLRERNPQVQLTPDQWRLFALVDGQTTLQMLCQALMAPPDQVRAVAGELIAIGLVMPQPSGAFSESWSPAPAQPQQQPPAPLPTWVPPSTGTAPFTPPVASQSQWGNGMSGASFVTNGGWAQATPQPVRGQPGAVYASAGGYR